METGEFDLGGGREPQIGAFEMKHVGGEFRQLANAGERSGVDEKRRQNFGVAVFARVHVEKEIGDGAFEARAESVINGETRAGDFHGGREIQNSGALADFPVRTRREIEFRRRAPAADFDVVGGDAPTGTLACGIFGIGQQEIAQLVVEFGDELVVALDFVGRFLHRREERGGVLRRTFFSAIDFCSLDLCCARLSGARWR